MFGEVVTPAGKEARRAETVARFGRGGHGRAQNVGRRRRMLRVASYLELQAIDDVLFPVFPR
eukprot:6523794-Lingulodinium_polyedra.AAC.1